MTDKDKQHKGGWPVIGRSLVFYDMEDYPRIMGWTQLAQMFYEKMETVPHNIYWKEKGRDPEKNRRGSRSRTGKVDFDRLRTNLQKPPMEEADYLSIVKRLGKSEHLVNDRGLYAFLTKSKQSCKSAFLVSDRWPYPDFDWYVEFARHHYDLYGATYGEVFDLSWEMSGQYIAGLSGPDSRYGDYYGIQSEMGNWQEHVWHRGKSLHRRYFRNVAPLMFLTRSHVNAPIENMKLSSWIEKRDLGALSEIRPDYWVWQLPLDKMAEACEIMTAHNLLLANLPEDAPLDLVPMT